MTKPAEPERWSGYATQSLAWQRGYDWAKDYCSITSQFDAFDAPRHWGYNIDSAEGDDWQKGADFAQLPEDES